MHQKDSLQTTITGSSSGGLIDFLLPVKGQTDQSDAIFPATATKLQCKDATRQKKTADRQVDKWTNISGMCFLEQWLMHF